MDAHTHTRTQAITWAKLIFDTHRNDQATEIVAAILAACFVASGSVIGVSQYVQCMMTMKRLNEKNDFLHQTSIVTPLVDLRKS